MLNKSIIFGAALLGTLAYAIVSCNGTDNKPNSAAGGQGSGTGGSSSVDSGSDSAAPDKCNVEPTFEDGGLITTGASDPGDSVVLDVGGYYAMPSSTFHGYCFTYADNYPTNGSTMYPPCGNNTDGTPRPCFTVATGICPVGHFGAGSSVVWGGGIGCNLSQVQGKGTNAGYTSIADKTSMTISVVGCKTPDKLQVQLNVANPPTSDAGIPGDGYFCKLVTLSAPDTNGVRTATVPLKQLMQDCWLGGPLLDTATMLVVSMQAQVNAADGVASNWDFCVSKWTID